MRMQLVCHVSSCDVSCAHSCPSLSLSDGNELQTSAQLSDANRKLEAAASELMRHHAVKAKMIALEEVCVDVAARARWGGGG